MNRQEPVARPQKKTDFVIYFDSNSAEKAWRDLEAVRRNSLADAWDYLTTTPKVRSKLAQPMKGHLEFVSEQIQRWQLKLSSTDGARIWYWVVDQKVFIEKIFTAHPNQTKK